MHWLLDKAVSCRMICRARSRLWTADAATVSLVIVFVEYSGRRLSRSFLTAATVVEARVASLVDASSYYSS